MSIWGKRVDNWFSRGQGNPTKGDWNKAGLNFMWQAALVVGVVVVLFLLLD